MPSKYHLVEPRSSPHPHPHVRFTNASALRGSANPKSHRHLLSFTTPSSRVCPSGCHLLLVMPCVTCIRDCEGRPSLLVPSLSLERGSRHLGGACPSPLWAHRTPRSAQCPGEGSQTAQKPPGRKAPSYRRGQKVVPALACPLPTTDKEPDSPVTLPKTPPSLLLLEKMKGIRGNKPF